MISPAPNAFEARSYSLYRRIAGIVAGQGPKTMIGLICAMLLASLGNGPLAPSSTLAQDEPDPVLEVWLHNTFVAVRTTSTQPPQVKLFDAEGSLVADVVATGAPANGRWQIDLSPGADFDQKILVRPGHRLEVEVEGRKAELDIPDFEVEADLEADAVTGTVPPGVTTVGAGLARDPAWFDAPTESEFKLGLALGGRFRIDFAGEFDLAPGAWGNALMFLPSGHLVVQSFAPPALTLYATQAYAILRADPGKELIVTAVSEIGTVRFRSAPAIPLGGAAYAVLMIAGRDDFAEIYQPAEGESVVVLADEEVVLDERAPRVLASIDLPGEELWGLAPPNARIRVESNNRSGAVMADETGGFSIDISSLDVERDTTATVLTYPGGSLARVTEASVPAQQALLYDGIFVGTVSGWGEVLVEHWVGEERVAWDEVDAGLQGEIDTELRDARGARSALSPGDVLRVKPELGREMEIVVPILDTTVDADARSISGSAPADSEMIVVAYAAEANIFGAQPYAEDNVRIEGRSGPDGSYRLACPADDADCGMRYGLLAVRSLGTTWTLQYIEAPIVGVGVTERNAIGRASAGLPVRVEPLDESGQPRAVFEGIVKPTSVGGLPSFEIPLFDFYPDGVQAGDQLRLTVGDRSYEIDVPDFEWQADVLTDSVIGRGPAGFPLAIVAYARDMSVRRPDASVTQGVIGPRGVWGLGFGGFDLRAGDDLELYLFDAEKFLWWSEDAIAGPIEPTPVPTAMPTVIPTDTPEPEPTPTAEPEDWTLYLPRAEQS